MNKELTKRLDTMLIDLTVAKVAGMLGGLDRDKLRALIAERESPAYLGTLPPDVRVATVDQTLGMTILLNAANQLAERCMPSEQRLALGLRVVADMLDRKGES